MVHLSEIDTPLGPMVAGVTETALCLLEFKDRPMLPLQKERLARQLDSELVAIAADAAPGDMLRRVQQQLRAYFSGTSLTFDLPLHFSGTAFQQKVWRELIRIPAGETRSYAAQAIAIGKPEAVRAVARANGDNKMAIVVPCHRVIGSDGSLTGYGGGLRRKRWLLSHEQWRHGTLFGRGVDPDYAL